MAQGDNLGAKFSLDITNLKAGLADANRLIRQSESEFIESAASMNDWSKSADGLSKRVETLNDQIGIQKDKMKSLIAVRDETIAKMKEEGAADEDIAAVADRVNSQLQKEQKQLETLQGRADKATNELEDFNKSEIDAGNGAETLSKDTDKAAKSAKKAGEGFTVLKGVLANLASSAIKGIGKSLVSGLSGIGKAVKSTVSDIINAGDEIAKSSEKAGFKSKTAYQEWEFVLKHTGTEMSSLNKGMTAISTANDKATKSIKALGVQMKDSNGKARSSEDIFSDVISKLSSMTDETKKSQIAQSIFGKSFTELRPLLASGADSVESLKQRAHELGVVLSDETLKESENMADSLEDFQSSIDGLKNKVVSGFLPSMRGVVDGLTGIFSGADVDGGLKKISDSVGDVSKRIIANAPAFLKTAGVIVKSLLQAITGALPEIAGTVGQLINDGLPVLTQLLISAAPLIAGAIGQMLGVLAQQLPTLISGLFDTFGVIINDFVAWLNDGDNLEKFIDGLIQLTTDICSKISELLPIIIPAIAQLIAGVVTALSKPENVESLISAALNLAKGVFVALVETVPVLIDFVKGLIKNLAGLFADFLSKAVPFVSNAVGKIVETVKSWFDKLKELPAQMLEIGKNVIRGIVEGMTNNQIVKWLAEKIKGIGTNIVNSLKSFFHIKSPSGLMRDLIGRNLALGIGEGFETEMSNVARDMQTSLNDAIPTFGVPAVSGVGSAGQTGGVGSGVVVYQTNNYSQQHSRFEIYQSKQATAAAVRAALAGG